MISQILNGKICYFMYLIPKNFEFTSVLTLLCQEVDPKIRGLVLVLVIQFEIYLAKLLVQGNKNNGIFRLYSPAPR